MEFAEHTIYDNQELHLLQLQEIPSSLHNELVNQDYFIEAILRGYQNECFETVLKNGLQENQPVSQQAPTVHHEEEGVLSEKELKNLKTWKTQERFGDFVEGTKILPCKTFLCEDRWENYLEPSESFHLVDMANYLKSSGLKIGLILDLNRSTTYYDFEKVRAACPLLAETKYRKFKLENGSVPCAEAVDEVCKLLQESYEKDEVVAIHCFNGINRTGYMICEFLCRSLGLDGETAIKRFEEARKHKMEHECMTSELVKKYPTTSEKKC